MLHSDITTIDEPRHGTPLSKRCLQSFIYNATSHENRAMSSYTTKTVDLHLPEFLSLAATSIDCFYVPRSFCVAYFYKRSSRSLVRLLNDWYPFSNKAAIGWESSLLCVTRGRICWCGSMLRAQFFENERPSLYFRLHQPLFWAMQSEFAVCFGSFQE